MDWGEVEKELLPDHQAFDRKGSAQVVAKVIVAGEVLGFEDLAASAAAMVDSPESPDWAQSKSLGTAGIELVALPKSNPPPVVGHTDN